MSCLSKSKNWFSGQSVKIRNLIHCVLVGFVLIPIMGVGVMNVHFGKIESIIEEKGREKTALICSLSIDSIISENGPALQSMIDALRAQDNGIISLKLLNTEGEPIASWNRQKDEGTKILSTTQPIKYYGVDFGAAEIDWDVAYFSKPMTSAVLETTGIVLLIGCLYVLVVALLIQKNLVRPLEHLDAKVKSIIDGSPPDPIEINGRELRVLDGNINLTAEILEEREICNAQVIRAEEQVKAANATAKAKMDFLSLMSHEIRTPLGVMLGFARLLEDADLDESQRECLQNINKGGEFLLEIINDILDLSKIEAHGITLEMVPFNMGNLCCEMESLLTSEAEKRGIELRSSISDDTNPHLIGDQHRLKQILINLVGNAIKFTEKGSVILRIRRVTDSESKKEIAEGHQRIRFEIRDTGVGMSPEHCEQIFLPFKQADETVYRRFGGTGLGLSISRQLVETMEGQLKVESEEGVGTTFYFEIELAEDKSERVSACELDTSQTLAPQEKRDDSIRILVAEDEALNRTLVEKTLSKIGYQVEFAIDGKDCLNILSSGEIFDVIFLDLHMPHVGGVEIARRIRQGKLGKTRSDVKLAIMSADILMVDECEEIGVDAFISKPVDFGQVRSFLEEVEDSTTADIEKGEEDHSDESHIRVLVMEDQKMNQNLLARYCEMIGVKPHFVMDGVEGIECLQNSTTVFDAIFLDLRMPRMDGFEVAKKIRNGDLGGDYRKIPIAVITAEAAAEDECRDIGVDEFIRKPLDLTSLETFVNHLGNEETVYSPAASLN